MYILYMPGAKLGKLEVRGPRRKREAPVDKNGSLVSLWSVSKDQRAITRRTAASRSMPHLHSAACSIVSWLHPSCSIRPSHPGFLFSQALGMASLCSGSNMYNMLGCL
jgi:hypothetical protein